MTRSTGYYDFTGRRFGKLVAVSRRRFTSRRTMWTCVCDCGGEIVVQSTHLRQGYHTSCGCEPEAKSLVRNPYLTFGPDGRHTRESSSYYAMKRRCYSNDPQWKSYRDKGIAICPRWKASFKNFLDDMGECPPGYTLERVDNSKGYYKENCVWATKTAQNRNRGVVKLSMEKARAIRADTRRVGVIAKEYGVDHSIISRVKSNQMWKEEDDESEQHCAFHSDRSEQSSSVSSAT